LGIPAQQHDRKNVMPRTMDTNSAETDLLGAPSQTEEGLLDAVRMGPGKSKT